MVTPSILCQVAHFQTPWLHDDAKLLTQKLHPSVIYPVITLQTIAEKQ